jgi:hypothetical protein
MSGILQLWEEYVLGDRSDEEILQEILDIINAKLKYKLDIDTFTGYIESFYDIDDAPYTSDDDIIAAMDKHLLEAVCYTSDSIDVRRETYEWAKADHLAYLSRLLYQIEKTKKEILQFIDDVDNVDNA